MRYSWHWSVLTIEPHFGWIVSGVQWTILVSLASWSIAFTLGSVLGVARTVRSPAVRAFAGAYVEVFRNVPLLVQMFLWYFVLPELLPERWGTWLKRELPDAEFWTAVVCLGLYTACRVCETVRSGIGSISRGQAYAGLATGLTPFQVYRHILLPVGYRIILPALTTEFLSIFKNSSLALTIGVLELTGQTRRIAEYTFQPIEMFLTATVLYGLMTLTVTGLMRIVESRTQLPGMITVAAR
ncbi:amino acid ABC transporter permease [Limobrevibacterium gyesilva]|uniref:Amino acid ABC transporter permease n=1 Tax=Limobrevibacterium gyesilva TaxID=2991712 RepID=A0AA41YUR6_9PROT|nr:amino acid ABC transporter permease [Limobrevibacterium gyesilva]MCW3476860.1 amino acid ABC transporter permease [Limobrevibacterium gyesilva]